MARLVVTGGMGFIGSAFVRRRLKTTKDEIVVIDKLTYAGNPNNLRDYKDDPRLTFVKGDVCDRALMDRLATDADAVVHFAAETHVDRSILEAGTFVHTELNRARVYAQASRKENRGRSTPISMNLRTPPWSSGDRHADSSNRPALPGYVGSPPVLVRPIPLHGPP